jgi:ubiquinone/menaquinone biosynthesis C-methylase UbiE
LLSINHTPSELRKAHELAHGKLLAPHAIEIWGWGTPAGQERAKRRTEFLINHARIKKGMKVLEYGCGTGMFSRRLAETGATFFSIDISPELIQEAKKQPHPQVTFSVGDIESLNFPNESFDAVIGSSVLHHVDVPRTLAETFRVLKPGGWIAFAEPNMMNPQIALQKNIPYIKRKMGDSPDETAFFRWRVGRMLQRAGFLEVIVKPFDFLHPAIPVRFISMMKRIGETIEKIPVLNEIAGSLILSGHKP